MSFEQVPGCRVQLLPDDIVVVTANRAYSHASNNEELGNFKVTFLKGRHSRVLGFAPYAGRIGKPLKAPAPAYCYRGDQQYDILLEHPSATILIHTSDYVKSTVRDALNTAEVDSLLLSIGGFSILDRRLVPWRSSRRKKFYDEVVAAANPRQILFTHWDDYFRRLDQPARWLSRFDDCTATYKFFVDRNKKRRSEGHEAAGQVKFFRLWGRVNW